MLSQQCDAARMITVSAGQRGSFLVDYTFQTDTAVGCLLGRLIPAPGRDVMLLEICLLRIWSTTLRLMSPPCTDLALPIAVPDCLTPTALLFSCLAPAMIARQIPVDFFVLHIIFVLRHSTLNISLLIRDPINEGGGEHVSSVVSVASRVRQATCSSGSTSHGPRNWCLVRARALCLRGPLYVLW